MFFKMRIINCRNYFEFMDDGDFGYLELIFKEFQLYMLIFLILVFGIE